VIPPDHVGDKTEPGVLPALEDKGSKTQNIPQAAAVEDLLQGKPAAVQPGIAPPDSAVVTVVLTVIGKFDKPPEIDIFLIILKTPLPGGGKEEFGFLRVFGGDKPQQGGADITQSACGICFLAEPEPVLILKGIIMVSTIR
jgi:hypothetical protein